MADIFLSYAREDQAKAKQLARALEDSGLTVWWDRQLLVGQQFSSEIEQEIEAARSVVVLWSANASQSRWVRDEAAAGADQGKLCPVQIDGGQIPMGFRQFHTVDLSAWGGHAHEPQMHELVAQLTAGGAERTVEKPRTKVSDPVLAVLPFDNLSNDEEMRFFSDGISEEILVRLMRGSGVKLIGRASSFRFRDERKPEAAKHLDCTHILDGSIRRSSNRVRTTVHLLDVSSEQAIWSGRFDDDLEDILDTQDRIAEAIAGALDSHFKRSARRRIAPDLYDRYLKAAQMTRGFSGIFEGLVELEIITAEAPDFSDAWGRIAAIGSFISMVMQGEARKQFHAKVQNAVRNCIRVDPGNLDAMIADFNLFPLLGDFQHRGMVASRMISAAGNTPTAHIYYAIHNGEVGRTSLYLENMRIAANLDPEDALAVTQFGNSLVQAGAYAEAKEILLSRLTVDPTSPYVTMGLAYAATFTEDWALIDMLLEPERRSAYPMPQIDAFVPVSLALRSGQEEEKRAAAQGLTERAIANGALDLLTLATIAILIGSDAAYDLADQLRIGLPEQTVYPIDMMFYTSSTLFGEGGPAMRENSRFPVLAARIGLAQYWVETGEWPDCTERLESLYPFKQGCIEAANSVVTDNFLPRGE